MKWQPTVTNGRLSDQHDQQTLVEQIVDLSGTNEELLEVASNERASKKTKESKNWAHLSQECRNLGDNTLPLSELPRLEAAISRMRALEMGQREKTFENSNRRNY